MKVKGESEKVGLKLNIQKTKIMASGPITSWEIDGETVETVRDFIFSSVQSLSLTQLFATLWTVACQAPSCEMLGWMKHKLESRLLGELSNLRYADNTTLMAEGE